MEKEYPYLFEIVINGYDNGEPTKTIKYALSYGININDARVCLYAALNSSETGDFTLTNATAKNDVFITY